MSIVAQNFRPPSLEIYHGSYLDNHFTINSFYIYYTGSISYRAAPYQAYINPITGVQTWRGTAYSRYSYDDTIGQNLYPGTGYFDGIYNVLSERNSIFLEGSINTIVKIVSGDTNNQLNCSIGATQANTLSALKYFQTTSKLDQWNFTRLPINLQYYSNNGKNSSRLDIAYFPRTLNYFYDYSTGVSGVSGAMITGDIAGFPPFLFEFSLSGGLLPSPYYDDSGILRSKGIFGDLSTIGTIPLTKFIPTFNEITGNVMYLPNTLQNLTIGSYNTIYGAASGMAGLSSLGTLNISGSNTISGDVSGLPRNIRFLTLTGNNTIGGDISGIPSDVSSVSIGGKNVISGDISGAPIGIFHPEVLDIDGNIIKDSYFGPVTLNISGNNTISGDISTLPNSTSSFSLSGKNEIGGDIGTIPASVTSFTIAGNNQITGDISGIPSTLTSLSFTSTQYSSLMGDISSIPTTLKTATIILKALNSDDVMNNGQGENITGSSLNISQTLTSLRIDNCFIGSFGRFSVSGFPTSLKSFVVTTYGVVDGNISSLNSGLTKFFVTPLGFKYINVDTFDSYQYFGNVNRLYGNLANLPTGMTYFKVVGGKFTDINHQPNYIGCAIDTYTPGRNWTTSMNCLWVETYPGVGLSVSAIDSLLIDLARTTWTSGSTIRIFGGCGDWYPSLSTVGVTSAGLAAYTSLLNRSITMRFNTWNNTGDATNLNVSALVYNGGDYSQSTSGDILVCHIGTGLDLTGATTSFTNSTLLSFTFPLVIDDGNGVLHTFNVGSNVLWEQSTSTDIAGGGWSVVTLPGYTTTSITVNNLTTSTWYRAQITDGVAVGYTDPHRISVTPMAQAGTLTAGLTASQGGNITFTSGNIVGTLLEWEVSTTSNTSGFTVVSGENALTFSINPVTGSVGSKIYVRTTVTSGACSIARSVVKTVTITV